MPPKSLTFKARNVTQALLAVQKAGLPIARLEIDRDGKIVVHIGEPAEPRTLATERNEWDEALDKLDKERAAKSAALTEAIFRYQSWRLGGGS